MESNRYKIDPNAPAFADHAEQAGISTRTYLAGLIAQGICAHGTSVPGFMADEAVARADALIERLNKAP